MSEQDVRDATAAGMRACEEHQGADPAGQFTPEAESSSRPDGQHWAGRPVRDPGSMGNPEDNPAGTDI